MWLSGQQKRPADCGEGQTGLVTISGGETAVLLDTERRGLEVYAPAGYHWTPEPDQRVLVIKGEGEIPSIVGVRQGGTRPGSVGISAGRVSVSGESVSIDGAVTVGNPSVELRGEVFVNGERLEELIARIVAQLLGG